MKKSLLAVAAIGAFASAAQAQSSVTVYGILDVGFQGVTTRGPINTGTSSSPVASNANTNITRFSGEGSQQTSRLGFRGTEDLGGGMSAFFTAEFALAPTDATLSGSNGNGLANRQTFVGLKKNGVGAVAIGTQYTPVHLAIGRTDPGQQNNMIGSVIYTTTASSGSGQTTTSYASRYNNALTLQTDRFAGFQGYAIYNNNNSSANNTAANGTQASATGFAQQNNNAWGIGVNYVWNKLNFDVAYQTSKNRTWNAGSATEAAMPATAVPLTVNAPQNVLGTSLSMNQTYVGAVYDFGILKAYAGYINARYASVNNSNAYLSRAGQQIGVRSFVTPTIEGWASIGNGSYAAGPQNTVTLTTPRAVQNFIAWQLGSNYWLSKRTNLYAIYGQTQVSSSSANISEGASNYGIGVRHTF